MDEKTIFKTATISLLIILSVLTTFLNTLCIYVICKARSLLKRPSTYFILNLLIVHLLQGMIVFPFYAGKKLKVKSSLWQGIFCDGFRFTYMVTFYAAIFSVLLIAIDRLIATSFVMKYKQIVTKQRVILTIIVFWFYVISLCSLPFSKTSTHLGRHSNNYHIVTNITVYKSNCLYHQTKLWTILMLLLNCVLPYILVVVCYQIVINRVRKIEKTIVNHIYDTGSIIKKQVKKHKVITKVSLILSLTYAIFWSPSVIYYVLLSLCPNKCFGENYRISKAEKYIGFLTKYLPFLDALAAPLIYCLCQEEFRRLIRSKFSRKVNHNIFKTTLYYNKSHNQYANKTFVVHSNA